MSCQNSAERIACTAALITGGINLALALGKLCIGFIAHSAAMISDGVHSASDVFSTVIVFIGIRAAAKASDAEHQYGHERMECVAAIILALLLTLVAIGIGMSGYEKIISPAENYLVPAAPALWAAVASVLVKEGMFWYTRAAAKKISSGALMADAWHHRSDALSSVGAGIGILGARAGYPLLDPIASILICAMIFYAAYEIFADALEKMVDRSCDPETSERIKKIIADIDGVENLDALQTRIFGNRIYVDAEICVKSSLSITEAHAIAECVHAAVENNFPLVKHCMVHVNPTED